MIEETLKSKTEKIIFDAIEKCRSNDDFPVWARWAAIDRFGYIYVCREKPKIKFLDGNYDIWTDQHKAIDRIESETIQSRIDWKNSRIYIDDLYKDINLEKNYKALTERVKTLEDILTEMLSFMKDKEFLCKNNHAYSDKDTYTDEFCECDEYLKKIKFNRCPMSIKRERIK